MKLNITGGTAGTCCEFDMHLEAKQRREDFQCH